MVAVVTQPDRPVGRKRILTPPPVKVEAEKHGIPTYQPEKIKNSDEVEKVLALEAGFDRNGSIRPDSSEAPARSTKYGCINVHASLLPELRGGAPIHYSILQGKAKLASPSCIW